MPVRLNFAAQGTGKPGEVKKNHKLSKKYPRVEWDVYVHPVCAVVGGGASTKANLDKLRNWPGDVFAINDTAKYLSDNKVPCYLYAIDTTKVKYRIGRYVKGAIFASRVNQIQFKHMGKKPIRVFDLSEENKKDGIEGGPTAVCRTPHLLLKMGYKGVKYFGIDASLNESETHVSGYSKAAYDNMIIINAGGENYFSNAAFYLQCTYMINVFTHHKKFFFNGSDGVFRAMLENPDTWSVVGVADSLRDKFDENGKNAWGVRLKEGFRK